MQDELTMANPKEARNVTQKDSNAEFNNKLSMADGKRTGFSSFWDQELFSCRIVKRIYHELREQKLDIFFRGQSQKLDLIRMAKEHGSGAASGRSWKGSMMMTMLLMPLIIKMMIQIMMTRMMMTTATDVIATAGAATAADDDVNDVIAAAAYVSVDRVEYDAASVAVLLVLLMMTMKMSRKVRRRQIFA